MYSSMDNINYTERAFQCIKWPLDITYAVGFYRIYSTNITKKVQRLK